VISASFKFLTELSVRWVAYCIAILVLFERCWSEADGSRKRKEIYLLIYFAFGACS
jgi:hypothetical protein